MRSVEFDRLLAYGQFTAAVRYLAGELFWSGETGYTRKQVLEQLADKVDMLSVENKRLREALENTLEVAYWMSGSTDFSPEGQAHKGWLLARPKLEKARQALEGGGE